MEYQKVKSAPKHVIPSGPELDGLIRKTLKLCSLVVGGTLGPGGRPVVIERFEYGLPPTVTKDGVTVFRAMGFEGDEHVIMEVVRDCSVRTAAAAGDGTTTAIVLAEAIVSRVLDYCKANPKVSPQRVVERLRRCWAETLEPALQKMSVKADLVTPEGRALLHAVAKVSGNGDSQLADAVMKCYDTCGDDGNVTIVETAGHVSAYEVEQIKGYPIHTGYERCCGAFAPEFVNDQGAQRSWLPEPVFVIYNGHLNDVQTIFPLVKKIGEAYFSGGFNFNVVVAACSFSETVQAWFAANFKNESSLKMFPLLAPLSPMIGGQQQFLLDLAAIAGCTVFDPVTRPLETGKLSDLGPYTEEADGHCKVKGCESFEAFRFSCNVIGHADDALVLKRAEEIRTQEKNAASEMDSMILKERLAKILGGIAKLKVVGNSDSETKERRDRSEDAICAVRGAIRYGCLPGGGWALVKLADEVSGEGFTGGSEDLTVEIMKTILIPSLEEPLRRILQNAGLNEEEVKGVGLHMLRNIRYPETIAEEDGLSGHTACYDASAHKWVDPYVSGLLDSFPAVSEALKNALSVAGVMGTTGGMIVFRRDHELERTEARATQAYQRDAGINEADQRA